MGISFLKVWVVSLLVLGGVVYPFLVIGTLNYSGRDTGLENMDLYYQKKEAIAMSLGNEPKLIVVGGSSAFYGLEALLMEEKLNIHVVNYGMQAGLGIEYQLKRLLRTLNDKDNVLLAFEGPLYATETDQFTDVLHYYVLTYDHRYLLDIGFMRAVKKLYGIPFRDFWDSWKAWQRTIKAKYYFFSRRGETEFMTAIGRRGDRRAPDDWKGPFEEVVPSVELKSYTGEVLKNFVKEANKRNIKVYFTWPTTARRDEHLTKDSIAKSQRLSQFLQSQGITVIDNYTDHLYPFSFYTDTPYHLSRAGTRIRTEKIAEALRPYFDQNSVPPKKARYFLLDERHHKIEYSRYDGDDRYDFKVYVNQADSDYMLDDSGIQRALEHGQQVYFSDEQLKTLLEKKFRIEKASCNDRRLETEINQYNNHIFFMVLNHVADGVFLNKNVLPKHFYDVLAGKGYKTMMLGTGMYFDINVVNRDEKRSEMTLRRKQRIGNLIMPFDLHMVSTEKPSSRLEISQTINFEQDIYKTGLWVLVYDPDLSIIDDQLIYSDVIANQPDCLYRVRH